MSNKKFKMDSDEDDSDEEVVKEVSIRSKKSVEDEYIRMNPREHVLLRPDMYVGAITRVPQEMWIWDEEQKRMVFKKIQFGMIDGSPFLISVLMPSSWTLQDLRRSVSQCRRQLPEGQDAVQDQRQDRPREQ